VKDFTVTLTGSAQRLSDVLTDKTVGGKDDIPYRTLHLQPDGANAGAIYVGATNAVTSSAYGVRLPAAASGVPPAPYVFEFSGEGPLKLSHVWVLGSSGEKLHILGVPF